MDKTRITCDILNDGYVIKLDGKDWIEQVGEFSKPMDSNKTFEENALLQIEQLTAPAPEPEPTEIEQDITSLQETNNALGSQLSQTLIQVMMLQQQVSALSNITE